MPVQNGPIIEDKNDLEAPVPTVSPLFAMGTSGPRLSRLWKIVIGVATALVVALVVFILLLSVRFSLPDQTFFFVTVSPRRANDLLTQEQIATLPVRWQQALQTNSRWPVLFGLTYVTDPTLPSRQVRAFTFGPRWAIPHINTDITTRFLIRQSGASTTSSLTTHAEMRYRSLFLRHLFSAGSLQGWLNPASIFSHASSSNRIAFHLEESALILSNTASSLEPEEKLDSASTMVSHRSHQADLSLHLAALGTGAYGDELLTELPLAPIQTTLTSFEHPPASLELTFASTTLTAVRLTFQEPLAPNEQTTLTSLLNQTDKKRVFTLPDGTLGIERLATESTTNVDSATTTAPSTVFVWPSGAYGEKNGLPEAPACGNDTWIARFSPEFLRRFLPADSDTKAWIPTHSLQIWRTGTTLTVCRESPQHSQFVHN